MDMGFGGPERKQLCPLPMTSKMKSPELVIMYNKKELRQQMELKLLTSGSLT
jgi:hypothetical protein